MPADLHARVTATILQQFDTADLDAWTLPWHSAAPMPRNALTGKRYRGLNIIALWCAAQGHGYIPEEWLALLAWRERIETVAAQLFEAGCPWEQASRPLPERFYETGEGVTIVRPGVGTMVFRDGRLVPTRTLDRSANPAATAVADWSQAVDEFVAFWSRLEEAGVHPDDLGHISKIDFALGLHPAPWAGPLRSARAYILALNPGLSEDDAAEEARTAFAAALRANLAGDQPYLYLLDEHATHPDHRWARRTFGPDITQADAADICMLQLVPYHSREGAVAKRAASALASSQAVRRFVRDGLLPHVRAGQAVLIVARSARLLDITEEEPGVVVYTGSEPRRAFQTPRNPRRRAAAAGAGTPRLTSGSAVVPEAHAAGVLTISDRGHKCVRSLES